MSYEEQMREARNGDWFASDALTIAAEADAEIERLRARWAAFDKSLVFARPCNDGGDHAWKMTSFITSGRHDEYRCEKCGDELSLESKEQP